MPHLPHSVVHNPHLSYRPDIDGLRALAIIAVVIFHIFPNLLPGGFVGVDVFFVISGYLITSIILKAQSGEEFSLLEFYGRRLKRILPALILVLVFCLVLGWHLMLPDEYKALGKHIVAGASYVPNLIFAAESGRSTIAAELKPLLHLWSLGIEEQFYMAWPLLLILALRVNLNPFSVILLLLLISFGLNVINIEQQPVKVFYLPVFRSWELLIGAMLSYVNLYKRQQFDRITSQVLLCNQCRSNNDLANVLAWAGTLLIVLALVEVRLSTISPFPGWWALFPTVGAVCLIAAGEQSWLNRHILANKYAVNVGLISYPLYLWHWPLLSFARLVGDGKEPSVTMRLVVVVLSVVLAWTTYDLVEKRLRFRSSWIVTAGLLFTLIMVGVAGYLVYRHAGYANRHLQIREALVEQNDSRSIKPLKLLSPP